MISKLIESYLDTEAYGANLILKKCCGFPRFLPLPCHSEHGWTALSHALISDIPIAEKKGLMLVYSERRLKAWRKASAVSALVSGPPFVMYRRKFKINKKKDAKGTVAFPSHSTLFIESRYDINQYCLALKSLPQEFHPVTICLLYPDLKRGKDKVYKKHGFQVVCAGKKVRGSLDFVKNFYDILSSHKYSTSNEMGTYSFYSVEMGIPFFLSGEEPTVINVGGRDPNISLSGKMSNHLIGNKANKIFGHNPITRINARQKKFTEEEFGLASKASPALIRKFLFKSAKSPSYIFCKVPMFFLMSVLKAIIPHQLAYFIFEKLHKPKPKKSRSDSMGTTIRILIFNVVEKIHKVVFGTPLSDGMRNFLSNVSWLFYAGIIVFPISLVIQTLVGRIIGPEQFGKFNLVVLLSSYLLILIISGLDISMIKSYVKSKTTLEKRQSIFSSFVYVLSALAVLVLTGRLFGSAVSEFFKIDRTILNLVIIYTVLAAIKQLFDLAIRAQESFKVQAAGKVVEIMAVAGAFLFYYFYLRKIEFGSYILILGIGMMALVVHYIPHTYRLLGSFSLDSLKRQLSEGRFFMLAAILGNIFMTSDRLLIGKFLSLESLGIYSAYYMSSIGIIAILGQLFSSVLLPASAKLKDKNFSIKLDQMLIKGFIPMFLFCTVIIVIFLKIFGSDYPLRLDLTLLFALISSLFFFDILYQTVIFDASRKRYLQYFALSNILNMLTIVLYYFASRTFGSFNYILIAFALNLIILIIIQRFFVRAMRLEASQLQANILADL